MPSWKKVVVSGSDATLNSLFVSNAVTASIFSGSFTGSLFGTASYVTGSVHTSANPALSASYAVTASYVLSSSYAFTASYVNTLTQNLIVSGTSLTLTPATTPSVSTFLLGDTTNGNQSSQILWRNYDFASKSTGFRIARISVGDGTTAYSTIDWTKAGSNSANINISVSQSLESVFSINGSNGFIGIRNSSPSYQLDVSGSANVTSALTVTGSVIATQAGFTGSLLGTASYVTGSIHTGANVAASSSFSFTASYVNPLRQDVIVSGSIYISASASNSSLLIGGNTTSSAENVLVVGIPSTGAGSGEGGQILLQAPNTSLYTSASMIDNYQNLMRILRGSNTGSDAVVTSFNLHSKQLQFPAYNGASAFVGTAVANLAVDSSGNVITVSTSGGTVFPYTGNAVITGSLLVSGASGAGSITASSAIVSLANNQMYFRGGDDAELWDVNERNTIAIVGQQDPGIGVIKLGSGSSGAYLVGRTGSLFTSGALYVSGGLGVTGSITVTLGGFTGSLLGTASYVTGSIFTGTNAALSASYAVTAAYANYVTGSGTTNRHSKFTAGNTIGDSLIFDDGTNVQITGSSVIVSGASTAFVVTGSVRSSGGFTGSLFGTASYVTGSIFTGSNAALSASYAFTASYVTGSIHTSTNPALSASYALTSSYALVASSSYTASYYQLVTGSAGTDFNISPTPSGSIVNIPDASTSARGLVTTAGQNFTGVKGFDGVGLGGTNGTTTSNLYVQGTAGGAAAFAGNSALFDRLAGGASSQVSARLVSLGANETTPIPDNNSYATYLMGSTQIKEGATGTHPIVAQLAIRPLSMSNGAATTANYANLYIEQPLNGNATATNVYAIWVDSGSVRFDGDLIMSQSNVIVTGSAQITGSLGITGSFSMGERVSSTGIYSTAIGSASLASGLGSLVIGQGVTASGYMAVIFADGAARFATASGDFSFVQGIAGDSNIHASGRGSFAQGDGTLASGQASHAQGQGSIASGSNSHAEGYYSFARGAWSHAEGNATSALGSYSHAEGDGSTASGSNSHAEGSSEARGVHSHSEGFALAIGQGSHAEGNSTSLGNFSHAEGDTTVSSGSYSHAEGRRTTARGDYSHAEGSASLAVGLASHAEGLGTISSASYQHAQGQYNLTSSAQSAFIIGNGTSDASRSNLVFASGSQFQVTGSVISSAGFTGSLFGTASYVTGSIFTGSNAALSASYAVTASYALNAGGSATAFPYTGSAIISGSLTVVGDQVITGSVILSGSTSTELRVLGDQQVTGSLNVTGSFFATNIKAGTVTNTSFTSSPAGSPSSSAVTLSPPFSSNNYAVTVTGNDARVWDIDSKTATGFTINSNSTQALTGDTYWIAIGY